MSPSPGPPLVLIVEDDRDIRHSIAEVLEEEGYSTAQAADGAEALHLLHQGQRPDVILLDLMMPNMSGFTFREEQLKTAALAAIPVVVITAAGEARGKPQALQAAGFLAKPLKVQPLLDMLASVLRAAAAARAP